VPFLWRSKPSPRFERSYENLSDEMVDRVDEAIRIILSSQRPERLGTQKRGGLKAYFAYELGRKCRILYRPQYDQGIIDFFRVCSHKEVYGP